MKYLVTGASGFIGGCLARQLLRAGHEVAALVRNPDAAGHLEAAGASIHQGDVRDKSSLRAPMSGVDGLFHLAAWYRIGVRDRGEAYRTNVDGTRNVLETARELGVPRIVYTSTVAVSSDTGGRLVDEGFRHQGPWLTRYERTKWMAHYQVARPMAEAGLPLVILQPRRGVRTRRPQRHRHGHPAVPAGPTARDPSTIRLLLVPCRGHRHGSSSGHGTRPGGRELYRRRPGPLLPGGL